MDQKEIFKSSEGDAWFLRNKEALKKIDFERDPLIETVKSLLSSRLSADHDELNILEVGCGDGSRSGYILETFDCNIYGIDPSPKAIESARSKGLNASVGTAENLPYPDKKFDVLIFGFCLYLCDRKDLETIANEASRVLKDDSWLLIMDFFSDKKVENKYSHHQNIKSYKMDYRKLFEIDHSYFCYSHKIIDHETHEFTDVKDNWVSISLMRRIEK